MRGVARIFDRHAIAEAGDRRQRPLDAVERSADDGDVVECKAVLREARDA